MISLVKSITPFSVNGREEEGRVGKLTKRSKLKYRKAHAKEQYE
jgi:hypothetical protein